MSSEAKIVISAVDRASTALRAVGVELRELQSRGAAVSRALGALSGVLAVGALTAYARSVTATLSALDDMAEITGESVENLSALAAEARVSGQDMDAVVAAADRLAKGLTAVDEETKGVGRALAALGVDARDANGELKNTPQLMREVAQALQRFADGPGKQAVLQDLFGRSGAQLTPFLNDLARAGELQTRVTAEQAAAAEAAEKAVRRLGLEIERTGIAITAAALPAIEGFTRGLTEAVLGARALRDEGAIAEWAERAAVAVAVVVDAFSVIGRLAAAVGQSFRAVAADISVLGAAVQAFGTLSREPLRRGLEERNRIVAEANRAWSELWQADLRTTEQAVRRQIDLIKLANQAARDLAKNADARDLRLQQRQQLEYQPLRNAQAREREIRDGERLIEQLKREAQQIRELSAEERVLEDLRDGRYRLTEQEKALVGALLEQNIALRAQREELERLAKADLDRLRREQDAQLEADAEWERRRQRIFEATGQAEEARKREMTETLELMIALGEVNEEQALRAVKAIAGIRDEMKETSDAAEQFGLVFASSIGRWIEDGGSARSFFEALAQDLLKLTTQLLIVEPLARQLKELFRGWGASTSGGGGNWISMIASFFTGAKGYASGGYMKPGEWGWVGERGPELAYAGRTGMTVIPVARTAAPRESRPVQINVNIPAGAPVTAATGQQIGAAAARALLAAHRRMN